MLLAIDIGNTNISFGIFRGNSIIKNFDLPSKLYSFNKLHKKIGSLKITDTAICSVVPELTKAITKDLTKISAKRSYILGKNLKVPIKNLYQNPNQVGQDRLVNAYAGLIFYGAPLIIIDSGTAITFDVISKHQAYLGGLILPGLGISLASLNEKTALLPLVSLKYPQNLIGRDTINSILSGVVLGAGALVNGLANKLKRKIGKNTFIIGTGGSIDLIKKYADLKIKIDHNLTLKGINLIYKNEIKNRNF
ncbi:MAG: type III pantothenate kinase [Candidatus Omnitrophica bacterium]|nr:type III pantothenate kinase [Candidatus Omnitrophota bacterium]